MVVGVNGVDREQSSELSSRVSGCDCDYDYDCVYGKNKSKIMQLQFRKNKSTALTLPEMTHVVGVPTKLCGLETLEKSPQRGTKKPPG